MTNPSCASTARRGFASSVTCRATFASTLEINLLSVISVSSLSDSPLISTNTSLFTGVRNFKNVSRFPDKLHKTAFFILTFDDNLYQDSTITRISTAMGLRYVCNMCDYSTAKKAHMRYHQVTHTGERPFKCSFM
ncbi:hypothetical protein CEXT_563461 [Caerostris extrusa]|uniref:C2H2-type domain-containing protein n=1 Tax=Caerostris extrusa TaxID=172846 RepID=A0AAV4U7H2_CAEEX|nr:hypothetical protein CEXT_563461 [Caerostris extrusa]